MMNPSFAGGICPQCGYVLPSGFQQAWMGTYPGGFGGMPFGMGGMGGMGGIGGPFTWPGTFQPGFPGWAPGFGFPGWMGGYGPPALGYGLGGLRRWGGTYTPQYSTTGLPTDEEITEMIYDSLDADPLIPWDADVDVSVDAGTVTLTGTVPNKRIKHAAGDDAWWIPGVIDVQNNLEVTGRHRARGAEAGAQAGRAPAAGPSRRRTSTQG